MVKIEIKPIQRTGNNVPDYLEKTIRVFGITFLRKKITPIVNPHGGVEFINRC